jgi:hypothetical protein
VFAEEEKMERSVKEPFSIKKSKSVTPSIQKQEHQIDYKATQYMSK